LQPAGVAVANDTFAVAVRACQRSRLDRLHYGETAEPLIQEFIERTPAVIDEVQRALLPGFSDEVAVKVLSGLKTAGRVLEVTPAG